MHDDSGLVARARAGDRAGFDALVARHHAAVYRQALRCVGHAQDAEEVAQNVFLKAYRALPALQQPEEFGPWLRAITARESLSCLRGARRRAAAAPPDGLAGASERTPEQVFFEGELRRAVRLAIESLPDHERRVARAFYLEGRSYREIEARFGLARSSIAGYLYKARQRLAIRLKGVVGGFAFAPGLASWWHNGLRVLAEGDAPAQVSRAFAAAASVAAVALVANLVPGPPRAERTAQSAKRTVRRDQRPTTNDQRPTAQRAPDDQRRRIGSRTPGSANPTSDAERRVAQRAPDAERPRSFSDRLLQTVSSAADLALGTRAAEASMAPPVPAAPPVPPVPAAPPAAPTTPAAPTPPATVPKSRVRVVQVEADRIVFEENGRSRAFVLRDGKLFVEEDGKSRPATDEETARFHLVQAKIKAVKDKAKAIKEKAEAFKPKREQIEALAKRAREHAAGQNAELRGSLEELRKEIEARLRVNEKELATIRARADELARRLREQAEQLKKLQSTPEEREKLLRELDAQGRALGAAQAEAAKAAARVTAGVQPLLEKIGPLAAAAAKAQQGIDQEGIAKLLAEVMSQVGPLIQEAGPLAEEAARLHQELLELNETSRSKATPGPEGEPAEPATDRARQPPAIALATSTLFAPPSGAA